MGKRGPYKPGTITETTPLQSYVKTVNTQKKYQAEIGGVFGRSKVLHSPSQLAVTQWIVDFQPGGWYSWDLTDASSFGCISFVVLCFPDFFLHNCNWLIASGVNMVGHFPIFQCNKSCLHPPDLWGEPARHPPLWCGFWFTQWTTFRHAALDVPTWKHQICTFTLFLFCSGSAANNS